MRKNALIAGFITALTCFATPVLALGGVELGLSYCVDDEDSNTRVYTNGCGVLIEGTGEVFFNWKNYILYKYQHFEQKNIHVTHIERDWIDGDLAIVIYYERKVRWANSSANEPKNACRNIQYGCPSTREH